DAPIGPSLPNWSRLFFPRRDAEAQLLVPGFKSAPELWAADCAGWEERLEGLARRCLRARLRGASPGASSSATGLKLRLLRVAHGRPKREPRRCGPQCLALLLQDVRRVVASSNPEEAAAAALCFHLLLLRQEVDASTPKKASGPLLRRLGSLWQATLALRWAPLLAAGWPVFGLLQQLVDAWPRQLRFARLTNVSADCVLAEGPSPLKAAAGDILAQLNEGGLSVPGVLEPAPCGWVESFARRLLSAWAVYHDNSFWYRVFDLRKRYFKLLPETPGFEMVLEGARLGVLRLFTAQRPGLIAAEMLRSGWNAWDVLGSLEVFFLFRSYGILKEILPPEPTIIEGGANDGIHVANWMDHWPKARVLAFEPDPTCFSQLQRNLGSRLLSARTGSQLFNRALAGSVGTQKLLLRGENHSKSAVNMLHEPSEWYLQNFPEITWAPQSVAVRTTTLDALRAEGLQAVDYIELDVQCSEYEVLKPSVKILPTATVLQLETCISPGMCKGTPFWPELDAMLKTKGFSLLATDVRPDSLGDPEELCFDVYYANLAREPTAALAALEVAMDLDEF
ncbi:unnamed protein product, partial [Effrenium voratum]